MSAWIAVPWLHHCRLWLAGRLSRWGLALDPSSAAAQPTTAVLPSHSQRTSASEARAQLPAVRLPLSMEQAVRRRDLRVLRREAADALAALGAAHALVASARFSQLQTHRQEAWETGAESDELATMAADYLGWQNDQVRLFDALGMVMAMRVPAASTLELIDPALRPSAEQHLSNLAIEYQRRLLDQQFGSAAAAEETG